MVPEPSGDASYDWVMDRPCLPLRQLGLMQDVGRLGSRVCTSRPDYDMVDLALPGVIRGKGVLVRLRTERVEGSKIELL